MRGKSRRKRALYISSPIGLGHAQRDVTIADELRKLHPDLEIDWLAQHPVTTVLQARGEQIHPASAQLANESAHIESESAEHDLHCFQAIRRMDEILLSDFMVFHDLVRDEQYDLWIGDEAWELDYYLHENPEQKRAAYVWLTDFVGWLPMPDGGEREAFLTADYIAELRPYLHGVAYRLTSSWADAEDVVADAWPRWSEWAETVDDPRGWLTRVVARLAVDHLRSARVRRESYTGPWLPEPVVTTVGGPSAEPDPLEQLVADESVRLAFLMVLDELPPEQRVAVVLHDALGVDFAGVAEVLGCSPAAARQYASRGRRRIKAASPPDRVPADRGWAVLTQLSEALQRGDLARLSQLLAPDVVMTTDGGGRVNAAGRPLVGTVEVARFLHGLVALANRLGAGFNVEPVLVNGDPGFVVRLDSDRPRDAKVAVYAFVIDAGRVAAINAVLAPDKLSRLTAQPPAAAPASTPRRN